MDVALGATDVPISRKSKVILSWASLWIALGISLFSFQSAHALVDTSPIHFSGDRQVWDRKANQVELFGHAAVSQPGETLTADYIHLDLNTRLLDAKKNCVYLASEAAIWGDEMHFNLNLHTGTVERGRVSNDKFTLRGQRIHRLGQGIYDIEYGEYTTCHDCSASWSLMADRVEMEIGGYANLYRVTTKIKDTPAFWLPYMVLPLKTRRQTGLLFPKFAFGGLNGGQIILPYFWAINRSSDMTFGLGKYTQRGNRLEWEGRYALGPRNSGRANYFYNVDRNFYSSRWGVNVNQTHIFSFGVEEKLRISEVSDNLVPFHFPTTFPVSAGEAFLPSQFSLSRSAPDISAFLTFSRYRNLLNSNPGTEQSQLQDFDPRAVQALPSVLVTTNEKRLGPLPLSGGLTLGVTNFTRSAGPFDYDNSSVAFGTNPGPTPPPYHPGVDPLRSAARVSYTGSVFTTFRPFDVLSVVPSLQYRGFYYDFRGFVPPLDRGYLLFQTDLSAQLERVYDFPDDPKIPKTKHLIRPLLTYSYIPLVRVSNGNHPFLDQIQYAQTNQLSGYNFDDYDIVPISSSQSTANYFYPLGNSLAYGVTTQWIRRRYLPTSPVAVYQTPIELSLGQAIDFRELTEPVVPSQPRPLSRFFGILNLTFDKLTSQTTYYYYADNFTAPSRNVINFGATWILERSFHQQVLAYDRSITLGYNYSKITTGVSSVSGSINFSINDYILPTFAMNYDLLTSQILSATVGVQFFSLSRCWKVGTQVSYIAGNQSYQYDGTDISLNLVGTGFGGVTEIANTVQSQ